MCNIVIIFLTLNLIQQMEIYLKNVILSPASNVDLVKLFIVFVCI